MSEAERFVVDGYASALVEALADFAETELFGEMSHCKRFSPGYGDVSIDIQSEILTALSAENLLGITLTEKKMMVPTKSITAIIGCK
jgi:cobalamin-dependent methionine synthase I